MDNSAADIIAAYEAELADEAHLQHVAAAHRLHGRVVIDPDTEALLRSLLERGGD